MIRLTSLFVVTGLMAFATGTVSAQGHCHYGGGHYGGGYGGGYGHSHFAVGINIGNPYGGYGGYGFAQPAYGYGYNTFRPVYAAPVVPVYGCGGFGGGFGGYGGYGGNGGFVQPVYGGHYGGCGGWGW